MVPVKPALAPVVQRSVSSRPQARSAPIIRAHNPAAVIQRVINDKLKAYFEKNHYDEDRNYMSYHVGALPHVGWKLHLSTTTGNAVKMAKAITPVLRAHHTAHKVDIDDAVFTRSQKFITIYSANEAAFANIISRVEDALEAWNLNDVVDVEGDMRVGRTGLVWMRHGQNTQLNSALLGGVNAQATARTEKGCTQWAGPAVNPGGGWTTLWRHNARDTFFFSKGGVPDALDPQHVAMAILVNGKIVPDLREAPNPGNAAMPHGVAEYSEPVIVGAPPRDPSPIALALNQDPFADLALEEL